MEESQVVKIKKMLKRYEELCSLLSQPQVLSDRKEMQKYFRERKKLEEIVTSWKEYEKNQNELRKIKEMIED